MAIPFECPHCGAKTDVDDEFAGQTGHCFTCGRQITIAGGGGVARPAARWPRRAALAAVILAAAAGVGAVVVLVAVGVAPLLEEAGAASRRRTCADRMERIGQALLAYRQEHGRFPPPHSVGLDGKPLHSWRVLILPYLEGGRYRRAYEQIRLDEPWDGPSNIYLMPRMPEIYACPDDPDALAASESNYYVVVGPGLIFDRQDAGATAIGDGAADTILLVESHSSGRQWMEPVDLDEAAMVYVINGVAGEEIGSRHKDGAHVLTADGKAHFLPDDLDAATIKALLTPAGGEQVNIAEVSE